MSARQLRIVRIGIAALACLGFVWACASSAFGAPFLYVTNSGTDNIPPTRGAERRPDAAAPRRHGRHAPRLRRDSQRALPLRRPPGRRPRAAFSIAADGTLTPVAGSPFQVGINPNVVRVDNAGRNLYVSNFGSDSISVLSIGSDGALTRSALPPPRRTAPPSSASPRTASSSSPRTSAPRRSRPSRSADAGRSPRSPGSPFPVGGTFPEQLHRQPRRRATSTLGQADGHRVAGFDIATTGALTPIARLSVRLGDARGPRLHLRGGDALYAANFGSNLIQRYVVAPNGALTPGRDHRRGRRADRPDRCDSTARSSTRSTHRPTASPRSRSARRERSRPSADRRSRPAAPRPRDRNNAFVDTDDNADFELDRQGQAEGQAQGARRRRSR